MLRVTPSQNVYVHRARLRVLLFAIVTVVTAWTAFTSYSAKADDPSGKLDSQPVPVAKPNSLDDATRTAINKNYGSLPLSFEVNRGQADTSVKYVARGAGYNIFLTATEAVFVLKEGAANKSKVDGENPEGRSPGQSRRGQPRQEDRAARPNPTVVRVRLEGANTNSIDVEGTEQLPGEVNYFMGNDSSKWLTDIATYRKVVYRDAYPGIDLVYYGNQQQLEYDFVVAPGADPRVVAMNYEGAQDMRVDRDGNLVLKTAAGDLRQLKPVIYQEIDGQKKLIDGSYSIRDKNSVGFRVSSYDRSRPLVIDPILVYSSMVNAGGFGAGIAVDSGGYAYITGYTFNDFNPTPGVFQTLFSGDYCAFVTKINQSGTNVVYSTYIGGNAQSEAFGIAVDNAGSAYITGYASGTYPTTAGAFQTTRASDFDCFITKLNPTGNVLSYSTFYGGSEYDEGVAITVNAAGNAYVAGDTNSRNLVTTPGALQAANGGGPDGFVLWLSANGATLGNATYLGGGGSDFPISVSVDGANNIYVAGETSSFNFPQVNALQGPGGLNRGIFKSSNNGGAWILSNTGLLTSHIFALAVHPTNPAIVYAATYSGVSKSTNGGATWVPTAVFANSGRSLAIDPTNPNIIYAGTANGVVKTTNGGDSWTVINNGIVFPIGNANFPVAIRTLAIDPSNPSIIYAGSSLGFYRTTNAGASWTKIGTGNGLISESVQAIVFDPAVPSTIYAGFNTAGIFKSTNSGVNWTAVNTGLNTGAPRNIRSLAIVPNSPATLYAGTTAGVFKTTNGGASWNAANNGLLVPYTDGIGTPPGAVNAIVIDRNTPTTIYAGTSSNPIPTGAHPLTSILKSTDGGANWVAVTNGFGNLNNGILSLAISASDPSILYAGNAGDFDGFAAKMSANGSSFNYSTIVGSSRNDFVAGIVPDSTGNTYLYGLTGGTNLPVTAGAFRTTLSGASDTFAMKLNSTGTARFYSTYLGGSSSEDSFGLAVDAAGNAYVVGWTGSADFPTTPGAFQRRFASVGSLGSTDGFVTKLNATGTDVSYSSFLGGAGDEFFDFEGNNIALDPLGNAYVVGSTGDPDSFPAFNFANAFSPASGPSITFVVKIDGPTPSYSINGRLTTPGGDPITGMFVEAENTQGFWRVALTDTQGFYSIVSLPAGNYTVTPQKSGPNAHYLFTPGSRTFNSLNSDQTANFTGTRVFDIRGRVTSQAVPGLGIFDVTVTLSGGANASTTTDADGRFVFRDLAAGANYTVTPTKTGFTFNPSSNSINLDADQDFLFTTPSATFFTVSGRAADAGNFGVSNVIITMLSKPQNGDRAVSFLTDVNGNYSINNLQAGGNYTFTASKTDLAFTPPSGTFNNLSGNQTLNFTTASAAVQSTINTWTLSGRTYVYVKLAFPNGGFSLADAGQITRNVNDFESNITLLKAPGPSVQAVTTTAVIYDLGPLANGNYTYTLRNGGVWINSAPFSVNSAVPPANPIDDARQFVKQQYRDFLNREADQAGEDFWTDNITKCNDPARRPPGQTVEQCTLRQRETTSGAFFLSPEFQYTGYFVYRMYQGALGRQPKLSEFTPDALFVGNGIIVGGQLSAAQINQNKAAFAAQFVNCLDATKYRCAEFKSIYDGLTNQQYVDKLFLTTGVNAGPIERAALVNGLNGLTETRASVLQKVVDGIVVISEGNQQFTTNYGQLFYNSEFNRAFVQLEYFGYMKRDPDAAGYAFWLAKLNTFGGNFVNAEMVLAFISSPEYRARFGQP